MRIKRDYMGNDQLLPTYTLQTTICDEYIAVLDVKHYASDMECFVPLMEKFNRIYRHYPKYPVADAGYGSYNNYLYCENHGRDKCGNIICPNGKKFIFKYNKHVYKNKYGRTEEIYECESCKDCPNKSDCCKKTTGNRTIRLNEELTAIHQEVINNLESIHGALLRMNRSIQAEGTFGVIKWNKSYKRLFRRGEKGVNLELTLISCGYNLYKYHNKKNRQRLTA